MIESIGHDGSLGAEIASQIFVSFKKSEAVNRLVCQVASIRFQMAWLALLLGINTISIFPIELCEEKSEHDLAMALT